MFASYSTDHFTDTGSYVNKRDVRQGDDHFHWIVTISYTSPQITFGTYNPATGEADQSHDHPDPTARPPVWKLNFVKRTEARQFDLDGVKIANSAGQTFIPAPECARIEWQLHRN